MDYIFDWLGLFKEPPSDYDEFAKCVRRSLTPNSMAPLPKDRIYPMLEGYNLRRSKSDSELKMRMAMSRMI